MYKYWTSFESEEHYLYPKEISQVWDLYAVTSPSITCKFNDVLTNEILKQSCEFLGKEPVYYETKFGLRRVFDEETIRSGYWSLLNRHEVDGAVCYYPIKNKRYKFVIGEHNILNAMHQLYPEHFEDDGTFIRTPNTSRVKERREELKQKKRMTK